MEEIIKKFRYCCAMSRTRKRGRTESANFNPRKAAKYARVPRSISVATGPPSLMRKLRYVDTVTLAPSTGASTYRFSANGMYDPDISGTGHQPLGFDQYMLLYDHYKVLKSKITVQFCLPATDVQADDCVLAIYLDDDVGSISNIGTAIEQGNTVWTAAKATGVKPYKLSKTFTSKEFFANKKESAELVGGDGSNPAEQAYWSVMAGPMNGLDNPADFRILVTIDYTCRFSEKKTLAAS